MHGRAVQLRQDLAAVLAKHGLPRTTGSHRAILPPTDDTEVHLSGFATVFGAVDFEHIAFARHLAFYPDPARTPLHWRHDESRTIGRITCLEIREHGLWVEAVTAHPLARNAGAFSIGVDIGGYRILNEPRPHALVTHGFVTEISLTDRPALREAAVLYRRPATSPAARIYDVADRAFGIMQRYLNGEFQCSA
jgi:hypothetical protein